MSKEYRVLGDVKVRSSDEENKEMVVEGYALKFGTESERMYSFVDGEVVEIIETIDKNALKDTDMKDVRYLVNHDPTSILGRTTNETVTLTVDDVGLKYKAKLPNTTLARDAFENIRVGNYSQCSFGFEMEDGDDEVTKVEEGKYRRVIKNIRTLFDVSVVTYPAYKDTDVSVALRSIESYEDEKEFEERSMLLNEFNDMYIEMEMKGLKGGI